MFDNALFSLLEMSAEYGVCLELDLAEETDPVSPRIHVFVLEWSVRFQPMRRVPGRISVTLATFR